MENSENSHNAPVIDAIDMEILMHRDTHFGASFDVMLEYYQQGGVGVMPDFRIENIKKLQDLENEIGKNLSEIYLPESAKNLIQKSLKLYSSLREVYSKTHQDKQSILISDLILSEEEFPEKEIEALVQEKEKAVPALIHLLSASNFYDPLYPGYGRSPIFAAKCLSEIQDERAILPLFEAIGHENFFTDEEIIKALCSFGEKAKNFLIKILKSEPISKDNEHAIIALSGFPEDIEIAQCALEVLQKEKVLKRPTLSSYLIFACSNLANKKDQQTLMDLAKKKSLPKLLIDEIHLVSKHWAVES